jgi:general secretion pathway protein G
MNKLNKKGFTLVELLVVIAIIDLLSTLAIVALSSARQKARDSKRMSDLRQIQTALELYYTDHNQYPIDATAITLGATGAACLSNPTPPTAGSFTTTGCTNSPMALVPTDPLTTQYYEYSTDANGPVYTIAATLEGNVGVYSGAIELTPSGFADVSP